MIVLTRPKDVNLEELFEVHVRLIPGLDDVVSPGFREIDIPIGTAQVNWPVEVQTRVNGMVCHWPRGRRSWHDFSHTITASVNDTITVRLNWDGVI